jgi:hypothetical protein
MCACGQRPVDNPPRPVDNPVRKILDAMSLDSKTSDKSVKRVNPSGVRDAVDNLNEVIHRHDQILGAILDAIDLINARLDSLENRVTETGETLTQDEGGFL